MGTRTEVEPKMDGLPAEKQEDTIEEPLSGPAVASEKDIYLEGTPLVLMTLALMAGIFMIALDNSILCTNPLFPF
jgi:hypothetical protein